MLTMKNLPQKLAALSVAALLQVSFSFNAGIIEAAPMQALTAASAYSASPFSSIVGIQQKLDASMESARNLVAAITSDRSDGSETQTIITSK
jgi:hypothetical protein